MKRSSSDDFYIYLSGAISTSRDLDWGREARSALGLYIVSHSRTTSCSLAHLFLGISMYPVKREAGEVSINA